MYLSNNHQGTLKKQGLLLTGPVGYVAHSRATQEGCGKRERERDCGPGSLSLLGSKSGVAKVSQVHSSLVNLFIYIFGHAVWLVGS